MIVVGGNCARSLAILLAAAAVGAIFVGFACDIGEKVGLGRSSGNSGLLFSATHGWGVPTLPQDSLRRTLLQLQR